MVEQDITAYTIAGLINECMKHPIKDTVHIILNREEHIVLGNTSRWEAEMDKDKLILKRRDIYLEIPECEIEGISYNSKVGKDV